MKPRDADGSGAEFPPPKLAEGAGVSVVRSALSACSSGGTDRLAGRSMNSVHRERPQKGKITNLGAGES